MGCIADEVQAVMSSELPAVQNVVGSTMAKPGDMEYGEFLTLDYARLVAPLCAAVGELRREVAALSARLQKFESPPKKKAHGAAASKPL